ncbi:TatD family hydrolase [bacterium]|nr:TatD family hydrolase [bacterium]
MHELIDMHCHYTPRAHDDMGVARVSVFNATGADTWHAAIMAARAGGSIRVAIGIHPWYVSGAPADWDVQMRDILADNPGAMVGEIGLDGKYDNFELQRALFSAQLQIAAEFGRVATVHCTRAWGAMLEILTHTKLPPAVILHRCNASADIIKQLNKIGNFYISCSGDGSMRTRCAIAAADTDKILIESDTDTAAMAPEILQRAVQQIADIRGITADMAANITTNNAKRILQNG